VGYWWGVDGGKVQAVGDEARYIKQEERAAKGVADNGPDYKHALMRNFVRLRTQVFIRSS
jgi:hypothetical protein